MVTPVRLPEKSAAIAGERMARERRPVKAAAWSAWVVIVFIDGLLGCL
jgi:hypothetical protein